MGLRITESRLPSGLSPHELGQAVLSDCGKYSLISNLTSPLRVGINNGEAIVNKVEYYVFINETNIAEFFNYKYQWNITLVDSDGKSNIFLKNEAPVENGFVYIDVNKTGKLIVSVTVLNNDSCIELRLEQNVIELDITLENLYSKIKSNKGINIGALAGNIETSREIINDFHNYIILAAPPPSLANSISSSWAFHSTDIPAKFLTAIVYELIFAYPNNTKDYRINACESAANFLNQDNFDEFLLNYTYMIPLGVCGITPQYAANILNVYPDLSNKDDNGRIQRIDLFNILRFPKTNIQVCSAILSSIKSKNDKYKDIKQELFLKNNEALISICSEFFNGLRNSISNYAPINENQVKVDALAKKTVDILSYPFISIQNYEPIYGFETYKIMVLDCRSGKPVKNAPVKRIKIGNIDSIFDIPFDDTFEKETNGSKSIIVNLINSQRALNNLKEEYEDNGTKKLRSKYDCGTPSSNYGKKGRTAYNKYWTERGCSFMCLNTENGGNPLDSAVKLIMEEYLSHRETDIYGYLNVKIPRILLLTQEKITIEVGFYDFPVVLEKQKMDPRTNPIMRSSNVFKETGFKVTWDENQSTEWGKSIGWKVSEKSNSSLFKISEKIEVSMLIGEDGKDSFKEEYTNIYFDAKKERDAIEQKDTNKTQEEENNPHAVLFAMQWCQPVWDKLSDAANDRINDIAFTAKKDGKGNWIKDLNMHIVSKYSAGDANPFGHYYGFFDMTPPTHRKTNNNPNRVHQGIDLFSGSSGSIDCFASHGGRIENNTSSSYGHNILLRLTEKAGPYFRYAHLDSTSGTYTTKERVLCGEIIAKTGRTGNILPYNDLPSHLHFELRNDSGNEIEPNAITTISGDIGDLVNASIMPSNKLPLIFPCKCKYGNDNQPVSSCRFSDAEVLKTCWAVQEFPYDQATVEYSSNGNTDHQSEAFIDSSNIIRFACPYIFKKDGDKKAQLQAQLKFVYHNQGKQPNIAIPTSSYFQDLNSGTNAAPFGGINGNITTNAADKTRMAIQGLIMAYMESQNIPNPQADNNDVNQFIELYLNGTQASNENVKNACTWLNNMVPII
ncbi:M23 family metallopeptidase [Ruminiclostridium herbifermentans]|uniref:M23 family metallopeptidase n=1 Tax=Ruminiclostridium herbifermentans TaxID=2488810 RepID=A0A7H1VTB3_9FIRM|nr:M23 family metallopeptidase [Ruminiclostridium herbifermentans]QNU68625.1 M23 family metallopeptidase [Ruminiclostridium herbifermentans]